MNVQTTKRLDFFIVGAQKSGTTALSAKLAHHPGLHFAVPKELHLFDNDSRNWASGIVPDLKAHFPGASTNTLWGEATPIYLYWPRAIERLASQDYHNLEAPSLQGTLPLEDGNCTRHGKAILPTGDL